MRIAIFSWETVHSVPVGGIAFHVTELACALERKGHEVHVFTRLGSDDQSWYEKIHGVHYHRCPHTFDNNFMEEVNNMCRSFVESFFETEGHIGPFDVIHAHDWLTANALYWIKQVRDVCGTFTVHSTEYGRCGNNFYGGQSEAIRHLEWLGCYCADDVITVSKALKNEVKWMYNVPEHKIFSIYNGIDYRRFDGWIDPAAVRRMYDIGPLDPMVLFVGRMVYQKGPDLLVDAIPHVLNYYSNAKFVFAGDGEMRWHVEGKAQEAVGKVTGEPEDKDEGKAKQDEGEARHTKEDVKDSLKK